MKKKQSFLFTALLGAVLGVAHLSAQAQPSISAAKPAYYVAEFQATDAEGIKPYSEKVESTFKPFSGRYVVRGGAPDVKEGFGAQGRLVVIKFDSLAQAQDWYKSPAYQAIIQIRQRSGNTRSYIVEGLAQE